MDLAFKPAGITDIDLLAEFMREFYEFDHLSFDEQLARTALRQLLSDDSLGRVWLIQSAGNSIGYVVLPLNIKVLRMKRLQSDGSSVPLNNYFVILHAIEMKDNVRYVSLGVSLNQHGMMNYISLYLPTKNWPTGRPKRSHALSGSAPTAGKSRRGRVRAARAKGFEQRSCSMSRLFHGRRWL